MNEIVITAFYPQQFELLEAIVKRIVARRGNTKETSADSLKIVLEL